MTHLETAPDEFTAAREAIAQHEVIAYPTEAVFGLGCLPDDELAVRKILAMKERDPTKGLILIAADYSQLRTWVDDQAISGDQRFKVFSAWPGPVTQLLPARADCPKLLRGEHDTIAVRVTDHEPARRLCRALGTALVSTSANRAGAEPLTTAAAVQAEFGSEVAWVMPDQVGSHTTPSRIINPLTGDVLRP